MNSTFTFSKSKETPIDGVEQFANSIWIKIENNGVRSTDAWVELETILNFASIEKKTGIAAFREDGQLIFGWKLKPEDEIPNTWDYLLFEIEKRNGTEVSMSPEFFKDFTFVVE